MRALLRQLNWFIIVGCVSAATHWLIAILCVQVATLPPIGANVLGWLVAFCVSFIGHYHLTFRHQRGAWHTAAIKFFCLSASGFSMNETLYTLLLPRTSLPYDILLALILIFIAIFTFLVSRFWIFRRNGGT